MKTVTKKLYVPIRISTITKGFEKENFVYDINKTIGDRGAFILTDGQILDHKIGVDDILEYHLEKEWILKLKKIALDRPDLIGGFSDQQEEENQTLELEKIEWSDDQKTYFGFENPYQVSEKPNDYSYDWALIDTHKPYLEPSERILALLHGVKDHRPFYCACHFAEVVYTSKHRFVCMSCGRLHLVLKNHLKKSYKQSLTESDWLDYFDSKGSKNTDGIELDLIDFLEIENEAKIWTADFYDESAGEFIFWTRATKEEIEHYERTHGTAEDLIQAGWTIAPTPPAPSYQLMDSTFSVDKFENAISSLEKGITSYKNAKAEIDYIKHGVLQLFHAIELILKERLEELDSNALKNKPDNPTVVKLLQKHGILFSVDELQTIKEIRQLRNAFQHAEAEFNYRSALKLMRNSIIFIDRFCAQELKIWIAEHISESAWQSILPIPDIQNNAVKISNEIIENVKTRDDCEISSCLRCETDTIVARLNKPGTCVYCRHIPTLDEIESVEN